MATPLKAQNEDERMESVRVECCNSSSSPKSLGRTEVHLDLRPSSGGCDKDTSGGGTSTEDKNEANRFKSQVLGTRKRYVNHQGGKEPHFQLFNHAFSAEKGRE